MDDFGTFEDEIIANTHTSGVSGTEFVTSRPIFTGLRPEPTTSSHTRPIFTVPPPISIPVQDPINVVQLHTPPGGHDAGNILPSPMPNSMPEPVQLWTRHRSPSLNFPAPISPTVSIQELNDFDDEESMTEEELIATIEDAYRDVVLKRIELDDQAESQLEVSNLYV